MDCIYHLERNNDCIECLRDIIEDQGKIIYSLHERWEILNRRQPYLRNEIVYIENQIPLLRGPNK